MSEQKENKKTTFTFGNFLVEVALTVSVSDTLAPYVLDGCTQKLQRKPASAVEKALATNATSKGKPWAFPTDGKRPKGYKRDSIPFSAEGVALLEVEMGAAVEDVAEVSVTEWVGGESSGVAMALAKAAIEERDGDEEELAALAKRAGYTGDEPLTTENAAFVAKVHERLSALRKSLAEKAKAEG